MVNECFDVFLGLVCKNFIEHFCMREIGLKFSSFVGSLYGLGISVIAAFRMSWVAFPLFLFCGIIWRVLVLGLL